MPNSQCDWINNLIRIKCLAQSLAQLNVLSIQQPYFYYNYLVRQVSFHWKTICPHRALWVVCLQPLRSLKTVWSKRKKKQPHSGALQFTKQLRLLPRGRICVIVIVVSWEWRTMSGIVPGLSSSTRKEAGLARILTPISQMKTEAQTADGLTREHTASEWQNEDFYLQIQRSFYYARLPLLTKSKRHIPGLALLLAPSSCI